MWLAHRATGERRVTDDPRLLSDDELSEIVARKLIDMPEAPTKSDIEEVLRAFRLEYATKARKNAYRLDVAALEIINLRKYLVRIGMFLALMLAVLSFFTVRQFTESNTQARALRQTNTQLRTTNGELRGALHTLALQPAQIQQSRYNDLLASCRDTNARYRHTLRVAHREFPPAVFVGVKALVQNLEPLRDCSTYTAKQVKLPPPGK